jgi:hypothetical protein
MGLQNEWTKSWLASFYVSQDSQGSFISSEGTSSLASPVSVNLLRPQDSESMMHHRTHQLPYRGRVFWLRPRAYVALAIRVWSFLAMVGNLPSQQIIRKVDLKRLKGHSCPCASGRVPSIYQVFSTLHKSVLETKLNASLLLSCVVPCCPFQFKAFFQMKTQAVNLQS